MPFNVIVSCCVCNNTVTQSLRGQINRCGLTCLDAGGLHPYRAMFFCTTTFKRLDC